MAKRVYFAFHYQDVIDGRANVVRNHNALQGSEKAGYYDASIWEEAKKQGELALKRMINSELRNTTVTSVLIGSYTYARRWVRYEIMKSIERGNTLLGVHVNGIKGLDSRIKSQGPNPFDYLGLQLSDDGTKVRPTEFNGEKWVWYSDLAPFDKPSWALPVPGGNHRLSSWIRVYDWSKDDGFNNFRRWVG